MAELRFRPIFNRIYGHDNRWVRGLRYIKGALLTAVETIASAEKVCHLHVYGGAIRELTFVLLLRLCARRVIITVHDVESFSPLATNRTIIGNVYRLADRLIVHNQVSKRELVKTLRVPEERIEVIPHGNFINNTLEKYDPAEARRKLGIGERKRIILFFGQIKEVKGLDVLIEAIPEVIHEIPDAMLIVAGRPWKSDFSLYERQIDSLNIRDRCALHIRYIPNEELALYFAIADLVVLPYRRIYQSGVVLMAMSYGRAVVVSNLPGMIEMVTDGQNGYVFAEGSPDDLAKQLIRALKDDKGRNEVALRALSYIRERHDWEKIGATMSRVYGNALS
jgi:glycosyltransferase involved in cell wall biosynthesis